MKKRHLKASFLFFDTSYQKNHLFPLKINFSPNSVKKPKIFSRPAQNLITSGENFFLKRGGAI